MARKKGSTLLDRIDTVIEIDMRRGACYNCGLVYNGYKRSVRCPKCRSVVLTDKRTRERFVTGSWIKMSDFKSENHLQ